MPYIFLCHSWKDISLPRNLLGPINFAIKYSLIYSSSEQPIIKSPAGHSIISRGRPLPMLKVITFLVAEAVFSLFVSAEHIEAKEKDAKIRIINIYFIFMFSLSIFDSFNDLIKSSTDTLILSISKASP